MKTKSPRVLLAMSLVLALLITPIMSSDAFFDEGIDDLITDREGDMVEGISVTAGNGSAILIWDAKYNAEGEEAKRYLVQYGIKSVQNSEAEKYDLSEETTDNIPSVKIDDLNNGTKYYFSIIAMYESGKITTPSTEVTITPIGNLGENMSDTPVVLSAEMINISSVRVLFSEDVIIPEGNPQGSFDIREENTDTIQNIVSAEHETNSETNEVRHSSVLLGMENFLDIETQYRVTVSANVTDAQGNPIESGSTDSAVFTGYPGDEVFETSEDVTEETESPEGTIDTNSQENESEEEGIIITNDVAPEDEVDVTPPEDVTNLVATFSARVKDYLVTLKWNPSNNTAGDLEDQLLYRSTDKGNQWGKSVSLGKSASKTSMPEQPETEITYKLTTKDTAGNESVGVIRSLSLPALPETGPGVLIALGIALVGAGVRRKLIIKN